MKVQFAACSESLALDVSTNRLSVFHIMDNIPVAAIPAIIPQLAISHNFQKENGDKEINSGEIRISINAVILTKIPVSVDFQGQGLCRNMIHLQGLLIPSYGILSLMPFFLKKKFFPIVSAWLMLKGKYQKMYQVHPRHRLQIKTLSKLQSGSGRNVCPHTEI